MNNNNELQEQNDLNFHPRNFRQRRNIADYELMLSQHDIFSAQTTNSDSISCFILINSCKLRSHFYTENSLALLHQQNNEESYSCIMISPDKKSASIATNCVMDELTGGENSLLDVSKVQDVELYGYTLKTELTIDNLKYDSGNVLVKIKTDKNEHYFIVYKNEEICIKEADKASINFSDITEIKLSKDIIFQTIKDIEESEKATCSIISTKVDKCAINNASGIKRA